MHSVALLNMFASRVEKFVSTTLPMLDREFEQNKEEAELTEYVSVSVMRTFGTYVEAQFDPDDTTNPDSLLSACHRFGAAAASLDERLRDDDCEIAGMIRTDELQRTLKVLAQRGLLAGSDTRSPPSADNVSVLGGTGSLEMTTEASAPQPDAPKLKADEKWHPQSHLSQFIDMYKAVANPDEGEFTGLVEVFALRLGDGTSSKKNSVRAPGDHVATPPLANLVARLQLPQSGEAIDVSQTVTCTRILCAILKNAEAESVQALHERQNSLNAFGVGAVVLRLISCETTELYREGLQLGSSMLKNGNAVVQDELIALVRPQNALKPSS